MYNTYWQPTNNILKVTRAPETQSDVEEIMGSYAAVINVSSSPEMTFEFIKRKFPSFWTPVQELGSWGYAPFFVASMVFSEYKDAGKPILIHCAAGVNRSVSVAYAVLMGMGYTEEQTQQLIMESRVWQAKGVFDMNVRRKYVFDDTLDFLKARNEHPTYGICGLLGIINSPYRIFKGENYVP